MNSPDRDEVARAVYEAFREEDYIQPNGTKDAGGVAARIIEVLIPRKVSGRTEIHDKAIARGDLIHEVFPSVPGPGQFAETDDPALAEAVWAAIGSYMWNLLRDDPSGVVQRNIAAIMGNGYVLLKTSTVGYNKTEAVYISDDYACIHLDGENRQDAEIGRIISRRVRYAEMCIGRQPHNARKYGKTATAKLTRLIDNARTDIALAVEAAANSSVEPASDDQE